MPQISHAYAVGRVRSLERNLLSKQTLERMISARTADEAARMLAETGWGDAQNASQVDKLAQGHMKAACDLIRTCTPEPDVTDCFLVQYDILNIKTLLKSRLMGISDPTLSPNGLLDTEKLRHAVAEGRYGDLPKEYQDTMTAIERHVAVEADPLFIDVQLDKLMYRMIAERVTRTKHIPQELKAYFAAKADCVNLLIALRIHAMGKSADFAAELFVEGGLLTKAQLLSVAADPTQVMRAVEYKPYAQYVRKGMERYEHGDGLAPLEKQFDDYCLGLIRSAKYQIASILPLVGYLLARERETAAVRLIVTAKAVNAPDDVLQARLRELYA